MNYDNSKYKIYDWKHPLVLYCLINPSIAIGELLLGFRIPKVVLIERNKDKELIDRTFVACPHCNTLHSAAKWEQHPEYKSWAGMYCDNCGKNIPYLTNIISYILLAITFPIWYLFRNKIKEILQKQQISIFLINRKLKYERWLEGINSGLFMFVFIVILFPSLNGEDITQRNLLIGALVVIVVSFLYGISHKYIFKNEED